MNDSILVFFIALLAEQKEETSPQWLTLKITYNKTKLLLESRKEAAKRSLVDYAHDDSIGSIISIYYYFGKTLQTSLGF